MNNYDSQIDQYLRNQLSSEERSDFEQAMAQDRELAGHMALAKSLMHISYEDDEQGIRDELAKIRQKHYPTSTAPPKTHRWWLWAILALGVASIAYFAGKQLTSTKPTSPEMIFAQDFVPYPTLNLRGNELDTTGKSNSTQAIKQSYERGNYQGTMALFEPHFAKYGKEPKMLLMQASALMKTGDFQLAEKALDECERYPLYANEAKWYRAFNALAMGNGAKAKVLLEPFAQNTLSDHHQEAKAILEKL